MSSHVAAHESRCGPSQRILRRERMSGPGREAAIDTRRAVTILGVAFNKYPMDCYT